MMKNTNQKPFLSMLRNSIFHALLLLVILTAAVVLLRKILDFPAKESETSVFIGILIYSMLPVVMALINAIIENKGKVESKWISFDFSQASAVARSGFEVPENITDPGSPVDDSGRVEIMKTLQQAGRTDTAIIDLQDGEGWWETRLLVLLAGAARKKQPKIVVFVAKDGNQPYSFQGWAYPRDLLPLLLKSDKRYAMMYHQSKAAARQWELIEPIGEDYNFQYNNNLNRLEAIPPYNVDNLNTTPIELVQLQAMAKKNLGLAFDYSSGLPNEMYFENLLATELQNEIERKETPKSINLSRLEELFRTVLCKYSVDESWSTEKQKEAFFENDNDYVVLTQKGKYKALVSRKSLLNEAVKSMMKQ